MSEAAVSIEGGLLSITLQPGETLWLRRSSLIHAEGPFDLTTHFIARSRFNIFGFFSGQNRWANKFTAKDAPVHILAGRDYAGAIVALDVTPDRPAYISPPLHLAHQGTLTFDTRRVAKKEFWTLTQVTGDGRVFLKVHGHALARALTAEGAITDTNYVAAITGTFTAFGKVFSAGELMRSGELENVRIAGDGDIIFQSENPEETTTSSGSGPLSSILNLLPI
jgi:uncharacterized protein (AIM24 family)